MSSSGTRPNKQLILESSSSAIEALEEHDKQFGFDPARSGTSLCKTLVQNITDRVVSVVFFGKYTSGKSTLLGSILDCKDLLPSAAGPTTAVVTRVQYGTNATVTLHFSPRRLLGPLPQFNNVEQHNALSALLELWTCSENPVIHVTRVDEKFRPVQRLSQQHLRDRLLALKQKDHKYFSKKSEWHSILIELRKREPLCFPLAEEHHEEMKRWIASSCLPLWLDRVDITHPHDYLRGLVLVDTPGIDSLNISHRWSTWHSVRAGQAILFLIDTRNLNVHSDDRRAYRKMFRWLDGNPEKLFHVGAFADISLDNHLDEHPMFDEKKGIKQIRKYLRNGLEATLRNTGEQERLETGYDRQQLVKEESLYLVNAKNLDESLFDGKRLLKNLQDYLAHTDSHAILQFNGAELVKQFENRETIIHSQLNKGHHHDTLKHYEKTLQKKKQTQALLESLNGQIKRIKAEAHLEIEKSVSRTRDWVRVGFLSKSAANGLSAKWSSVVELIIQKLDRNLKNQLKDIEEKINDILDIAQRNFTLQKLDRSNAQLNMEAIWAPMKNFDWYIKSFFDFFGTSFREINIKKARNKALEELTRIKKDLIVLSDQRIDETYQQTKGAIESVRDAMAGMEKKLDELHGNVEAVEELKNELIRIADQLCESRLILIDSTEVSH